MAHKKRFSPSAQSGLSLIELLIASALGLLIVAALTQLFADVTKNNRELEKTNSQIESARFAIQLIRNDIVHAGYWASFIPEFDNLMSDGAPTDKPTIVPDPCLAFASWSSTAGYVNSLLGIPVQVYESSPSTLCNSIVTNELVPSLPASGEGTDVLVVRHAQQCRTGGANANCPADITGELYFQPSNCAAEIDSGSLYVLDSTSHILTERSCVSTDLAAKRRYIQNIYYIRDFSVAGDGIPTLVRSEYNLAGSGGQAAAQALVPGIERLHVELGIDSKNEDGELLLTGDYDEAVDWKDPLVWNMATNRGDGSPDAFVHCSTSTPCTVLQLMNVVALKVYVLARAEEPTPGYVDTKEYQLGSLTVPPFGDNYKRHVFGSTVRLNNVAGRRETP